jgi:hypothetical protein
MDMMAWWRANYLGWFRFRAGEAPRVPSLRPAHAVVEPNND